MAKETCTFRHILIVFVYQLICQNSGQFLDLFVYQLSAPDGQLPANCYFLCHPTCGKLKFNRLADPEIPISRAILYKKDVSHTAPHRKCIGPSYKDITQRLRCKLAGRRTSLYPPHPVVCRQLLKPCEVLTSKSYQL